MSLALKRVRALLFENVNGLFFLAGLFLLVGGICAWSPAAAAITAGVVLMAVATLPYLLTLVMRKGRN